MMMMMMMRESKKIETWEELGRLILVFLKLELAFDNAPSHSFW